MTGKIIANIVEAETVNGDLSLDGNGTGAITTSSDFFFRSVLFASLGTPPDGAVVFVSDGTPGSSPLTGSGTGTLAIRRNGGWHSL